MADDTSYSPAKALALHLKNIEKHPPERDDTKIWEATLADGLEPEKFE